MQLKGQLRMYMRWPLIMTLLLIGMDVWMYMVDKKAGLLMSVIIIIYVGIAFSLYFYNRSLILADLIQFSVQYKGIENRLLKELDSVEEWLLFESDRGSEKRTLSEPYDSRITSGCVSKKWCGSCRIGSNLSWKKLSGRASKSIIGGIQWERRVASDSGRAGIFCCSFFKRCNRTECLHPRERRSANDCRIDLYW